jgi:hypothetical protein
VDERIHARVFGCTPIARLHASGGHHDRHCREPGLSSQPPHDVDSAAIGEAHVHDGQIGLDIVSEQNRNGSVAGLDDAMTSWLDRKAKQKAKTGIVFADENRGSSF